MRAPRELGRVEGPWEVEGVLWVRRAGRRRVAAPRARVRPISAREERGRPSSTTCASGGARGLQGCPTTGASRPRAGSRACRLWGAGGPFITADCARAKGGPFTFLPIAHAVLGARSWSACRFEALGELMAARAIARSAARSVRSRSANLRSCHTSRACHALRVTRVHFLALRRCGGPLLPTAPRRHSTRRRSTRYSRRHS